MIRTEPQRPQRGIANIVQAMRQSDQLNTFSAKLADLYMTLNQYDKALNSYDKFLSQFKADFEAWTKRGQALFKLGKYQEAVASFEKALALKPDYAPANEGLSRLGRSRRDDEPAVAWQ
jgi:tetratricopeptide (TPR) repeat protein